MTRPRILVVDDQPLICSLLRRELDEGSVGCEVESVAGGASALAKILGGGPRYSLILCDLMMPGLSGFDVVETLAREAPSIVSRVVVMTGRFCTVPELRRFGELGVKVIQKPFGSLSLLTIVRGYLAALATE